jgi:hypothetical protein
LFSLENESKSNKTLQNKDLKGLISVVGTEAVVPY